jgi:multidrug resistance efflux pump
MSTGSTTTAPSTNDPLFSSDSVSFQVNLDNLDSIIDEISSTSANIQATMAGRPNGVTAKHLSKVWKIDAETAKRTFEVTRQLRQQKADASLSRNYSTNDRKLRYKRINSHFFTDTF